MACPLTRVGPGWEAQFAVNHLGHFALVHHLWPALRRGRDARVVVVSSNAVPDAPIRWDDPHFTTGYDKWQAYAQSKAANALFAAQLDVFGTGGRCTSKLHPPRRDPHPTAAAPDPGGDARRRLDRRGRTGRGILQDPGAGRGDAGVGGDEPGRRRPALRRLRRGAVPPRSAADAARLWTLSESLTGLPYARR